MAIELVSFDNIKSVLGLEGGLISDYPDLQIIRDSVHDAFENFLGIELEFKERTETCKYIESRMIRLKGLPIDTVSEITINGSALADSNYFIMDYGVLLVFQYQFGDPISITYNGGLVLVDEITGATTVPADIKRAALLQTIFEYQGKENIAATSITTEGGNVQRPDFGLLAEVKRLLQKYKHPMSWN